MILANSMDESTVFADSSMIRADFVDERVFFAVSSTFLAFFVDEMRCRGLFLLLNYEAAGIEIAVEAAICGGECEVPAGWHTAHGLVHPLSGFLRRARIASQRRFGRRHDHVL